MNHTEVTEKMGKATILFHMLVALQFVILRGAFQIKSLLRLC